MDPRFHSIKLKYTTVFLLKCDSGYLLIDTSYPDCYDTFKEELQKAGIPLDSIRFLLLTHHHDDHAGFAAGLLEDTSARLICHENALEYLESGRPDEHGEYLNRRLKYLLKLFSIGHDERYPPVRVRTDDIIITNDSMTLLGEIGIDGEILYTPGHTYDHRVVLLDSGDCFAGDLVMNYWVFNILGGKYHPMLFQDSVLVQEGWKKIVGRGAKRLFPSHGGPFLQAGYWIDLVQVVHGWFH